MQPYLTTSKKGTDRSGSTLLIVMVLLGMLSILGVVFYTFAAQEKVSAEYYADAAKVPSEAVVDVDDLMDHALRQVIVGPYFLTEKNSALWGSRHSLLPNMLGLGDGGRVGDLDPYNGEGLRTSWDASGNIAVTPFDRNGDGVVNASVGGPDAPQPLYNALEFNDSPSAPKNAIAGSPTDFERQLRQNFPQPDVDYTAPDINNIFLSYEGFLRDPASGTIHRVIVPSFHRPQYLRQPGPLARPMSSGGGFGTNWHDRPETASRVMRPHPSHKFVNDAGTISPATRFLTDTQVAARPDWGMLNGFPFKPMADTYDVVAPAYRTGSQGVWSETFTPTGATPAYDFDVDNDSDGIRDSVWVDLDFPPQRTTNGDVFVPIYSIMVKDLDGLINLNAHGNLAALTHGGLPVASAAGVPFGYDALSALPPGGVFHSISKSNQGLGPAEVNPIWALNARPTGDSQPSVDNTQYQYFFGNAPTSASGLSINGWKESANMDWFSLVAGRPSMSSASAISNLVSGRYGEADLHQTNLAARSLAGAFASLFPQPGKSKAKAVPNAATDLTWDDNQDGTTRLPGELANPSFGQPLDFTGLGSMLDAGNNKAVRFAAAIGRMRFVQYLMYSSSQFAPFPVAWRSLLGGILMPSYRQTALEDDPYEMPFNTATAPPFDAPFSISDNLFLHSSQSEIDRLAVSSRLGTLARFNFQKSQNSRAEDIRKRFSTISNDRKAFSNPRTSGLRTWESNVDAPSGTQRKFPPAFGTITRYAANDPFRPELRFLLEQTERDTAGARRNQKLSLNQLLTSRSGTGTTGNESLLYYTAATSGLSNAVEVLTPTITSPDRLVYRDLTPHDIYQPAEAHRSMTSATITAQEKLARADRQAMARDIYVLLYTLSGDDSVNITTSPLSPLAAREMAQYAVNLVDRLDGDNVSTTFFYDPELYDGWATTGLLPVQGVESQELTFSEALLVGQPKSNDSTLTPWTETTAKDNYWLYFELQNVAPRPVSLTLNSGECSARQFGIWRIRRADNLDDVTFIGPNNGGNVAKLTVQPGATHTIGMTDTTNSINAGSDLRVDFDGSTVTGEASNFNLIAPDVLPTDDVAPVAPKCHLDMVTDTALRAFRTGPTSLVSNASPPTPDDGTGTQIGAAALATTDANKPVRYILERRANPELPLLSEQDNPWVPVDQIDPGIQVMPIVDTTTAANLQNTTNSPLRQLQSSERREPFERIVSTSATTAGETLHPVANIIAPNGTTNIDDNYRANTLRQGVPPNSNSPANFQYLQHHFNRAFASVGESLSVPVCGPELITKGIRQSWKSPKLELDENFNNLKRDYPLATSDTRRFADSRLFSGAAKFLQPQNATNTVNTNRWHRLLEFVEVPTRTNVNLGVGSPFAIQRVPGKINLNTVRHPDVLAALLDDENQFDLQIATAPNAPVLLDRTEAGRDWWNQLTLARSAVPAGATADPFYGGGSAGLPFPGLPGSRPLRGFGAMAGGAGTPTLDETILRALPADGAPGLDRRHLHQVGTNSEHTGGSLDPQVRERMLSKIANNVTTRSNTFAIFITVKYFRAIEDTTNGGAIRIGEPLNGVYTPEHRGFFIVDRTKLEAGYQTGGTFDWRAFVEYRRILQ